MRSSIPKHLAGTTPRNLRTAAWLLRGISAIPGELHLSGSRLTFTATGTGSAWDWQLRRLEHGSGISGFAGLLKETGRSALFSETLLALTASCPWYFFSGGLVIEIRDQTYKISFGRPVDLAGGGDDLSTFYAMRKIGKQWIRALTTP